MLRDTQRRNNKFGSLFKPTKTSPAITVKNWLLKNFKVEWWSKGQAMYCEQCPQKTIVKPCWNCLRWDSWIRQFREGKLK